MSELLRRVTLVTMFSGLWLALAVGLSSTVSAQMGTPSLGPTGTVWGGQHVTLEVTAEGAELDFDCASGSIPAGWAVDAKGNFKVKGTFTREHGGPVMRNDNNAVAAIYTGNIQGNTLRLSIVAGAQSESVGDFVLARDNPGRVVKCK